MRSVRVAATVAACAAVLAGGGVSLAEASPAAPAGPWRTAIEIPGLAALDQGGDAEIDAMSWFLAPRLVPARSAVMTGGTARTSRSRSPSTTGSGARRRRSGFRRRSERSAPYSTLSRARRQATARQAGFIRIIPSEQSRRAHGRDVPGITVPVFTSAPRREGCSLRDEDPLWFADGMSLLSPGPGTSSWEGRQRLAGGSHDFGKSP